MTKKKLTKKEILTECLLCNNTECICDKNIEFTENSYFGELGGRKEKVGHFLPDDYLKYCRNIIKKYSPTTNTEELMLIDDYLDSPYFIDGYPEDIAILAPPTFIRGKKLKRDYLHQYKLLLNMPLKQYTPVGTNLAYNISVFLYKKLDGQL